MNILLLGSQHGNELLGELLYAHIKANAPDLLSHVTFKIANPKAHAAKKRYIDSDMNRSYDSALSTYESAQAARILSYIEEYDFDLILDLHTTVCDEPPCFIVKDIYDENRNFLTSSSIDRIVLMQAPIVRTSLIGVIKKAVCIEVANEMITESLLDALCSDLRHFIDSSYTFKQKRLYPVDELILKTSVNNEDAARFENFKMSALGFIPILVGENSYKKNTEYLGFKASKETIITL